MKRKKTGIAVFLAAVLVSTCVPQISPAGPDMLVAEAHGGRTDGRGGHRDNKNRSGLGSYHYHCDGYPAHLHPDGVCPYRSGQAAESTPAPRTEETEAAAAAEIPENIDLVFDPVYYADHNPDLCQAFGYDRDCLLEHFLTSGMKEGRVAREDFDVNVYRRNYQDLQEAYGDDLPSYYRHYMDCGCREGRTAS
ncbi:MAG TPA: YHYH domain-containing protein [Candidatus Lachnoclostridium stercorigallinarum]|uniref:YHYH domain-containing protein n=1 Tax=Candidatus Lachnoclostridium stercorigallinarum TaxID=2838634 RepID=A0A9D2K7X3_9FIRM|nr:YHYH domain-containing protein [Candidatus Lachnoclostridium stercorigallinarum]